MGKLSNLINKKQNKRLSSLLGVQPSKPVESNFIKQSDITRRALERAESDIRLGNTRDKAVISVAEQLDRTPQQKAIDEDIFLPAEKLDVKRRTDEEARQFNKQQSGIPGSLLENPLFSKVAGAALTRSLGLQPLVGTTGQEFQAGVASSVPILGKAVDPSAKMVEAQSEAPRANINLPLVGGVEVTPVGLGKTSGTIGATLAQYGAINKVLEGLGATTKLGQLLGGSKPAKFVANQGVDLLADTLVQAPTETLDAIYNDKSLAEDAKQILTNRAIDVGMNLAIGGSSELLKTIFKTDPNTVRKSIDQLPPEQAKTIQQELGLDPSVTAQDIVKQSEDIARDIEIENFYKQFEKTPQQELEAFQAWRKQNFGGATGNVVDSEMTALKDLYKQDTGIDLDVALKEASDVQAAQPNRLSDLLKSDSEFKVSDMSTGSTSTSKVIDDAVKKQSVEFEKFKNEPNAYEDLKMDDPFTMKTTVDIDSLDMGDKVFNSFLKKGYSVPEAELADNFIKGIADIPTKDLNVTSRWTTDVYRNFESVFGKDSTAKKLILDPFDKAKGFRVDEEIKLLDDLQSDIVKDLGIGKGTKESSLVQKYGEGNIDYDGLVKEVGEIKAENIVKADEWFRGRYDKLIDDINNSRTAIGKDPIPKLDNYYRHFTEMGDTFAGIKNVFETNKQIAPKLEGLSEFTKPGEKWASFKQKRLGGKFKEDAVGGFLDYTRAATYAKHIDPQITRMRTFQRQLADGMGENTKLNNYLGFMDEFINGLSGKTNKFDRAFQDLVGRKAFAVMNLLNSRMKSNAVLGNASSALSQIANVPQGLATVKNPVQIAQGLEGYIKSIFGKGDVNLYKKSNFLKERLTDSYSKFDTKIIDQPKKFAAWSLGALDEVGTKFMWSMNYRKAVADGVQNPIKYADEVTRKLVAGRGIGEVPVIQQSKLFQLVAPFTLEVGNLWKVQKDFVKSKDFGALAILYGANFLLNNALEDVRGSRVTFDPIDAALEGLKEEGGVGDKMLSVAGNVGGEILGNIPLGQSVASIYPEYGGEILGKEIPTRKELFGESDPTRYGIDLPLVRAIQKPISSFVLPFGGQQVRKTIEGAQALGLVPKLTKDGFETQQAATNKKGKLITPTERNLESVAKGLLFGKYAIPNVKNVYDEGGKPFGEKQTDNFNKLISTGDYDQQELFQVLTEAKKFRKKAEVEKVLSKVYNGSELREIMRTFFNYK
jgi:hypothetical protein